MKVQRSWDWEWIVQRKTWVLKIGSGWNEWGYVEVDKGSWRQGCWDRKVERELKTGLNWKRVEESDVWWQG